LAASPSTLAVAGRVLGEFPRRPLSATRWTPLARRLRLRRVHPRDLLLSFRALSSLPELLATSEEVRVPPLLGFVRFPPLCRTTSDASTPGSLRSLRSDGATHRILFRPRGFSPPRRLAPHRRCGFVAPRCRLWGPSRFPGPVPPSRWRWVRAVRSPRRGTPYEEFPSSAAVPHRCGRCLLDVSVRPPGLTRPVARAVEERSEQVRWRSSPRGPACAVPRGPSSFRGRGAGVDPRRP
jgi:hypothetical protein